MTVIMMVLAVVAVVGMIEVVVRAIAETSTIMMPETRIVAISLNLPVSMTADHFTPEIASTLQAACIL